MVYTLTDDRDFTVKNADILFPGRIKQLRGVMSLFGLKNGFVKVIQLVSCQESVIRARGKSG
jgi:tRNA(His) 5'-end guanylyltransferase